MDLVEEHEDQFKKSAVKSYRLLLRPLADTKIQLRRS